MIDPFSPDEAGRATGFPTVTFDSDFQITVLSGDTTKPVITASAKKTDGSGYLSGTWTNQNVTVSFTCTDEVGASGIPAGA